MSVADHKDENAKALNSASLGPKVFDANQENALDLILAELGFGNFKKTERFKQFLGTYYLGEIVTVSCNNADTEYSVTHNLRGVPSGFIVVDSPGLAAGHINVGGGAGATLFRCKDTAWTATTAYFWSNDDKVIFKVWLWKEF